MKTFLFTLCLVALAFTSFAHEGDTTKAKINPAVLQTEMTNAKMDEILRKLSPETQGEMGNWQVPYYNRLLLVITDEANNRMRIISPIVEEKKIKKEEYPKILSAQFHLALDVKYALFNEMLWSVYAHPLGELTEEQFKDALNQVFFAAHNYGGTYKSTDLEFGSGDER